MPTQADAQKWVQWADSVDPKELELWKRSRPKFNEEEVRKLAATPAKPDKRAENYNKVKDTMAEVGIDVEPNVWKDMAVQASTAPLRVMTDVAGLPGLAEQAVGAGSAKLLEMTGTAPQEKIDSYRQNAPQVLPQSRDIEKFLAGLDPFGTGAREYPRAQTEPGRVAGRAARAGTEVAALPLSTAQKVMAASGMFLGGEGGRSAANAIGMSPDTGEMIGEIAGAPTALALKGGGKALWDRVDNNFESMAKAKIKRQFSDEDIQDVVKGTDAPGYLNPRTQNFFAKSINESTQPYQAFDTIRDADPGAGLMDQISRTAYGKDLSKLRDARKEAYRTSVDEARPYNVPEENVKKAREILRNNKGFQKVLDTIDEYERVGKNKPTQTIRNVFEGNPKKSPKNVFVDPKQLDRFASQVSSNLNKLDNEKARRTGQTVLDEVIDLLGDAKYKQARRINAQEKSIEEGKEKLVKLAQDVKAPEVDVKNAISETTGITDEALLDSMYSEVKKARERFRVIDRAQSGGTLASDVSLAERKFNEGWASLMAGLRKRAIYVFAQSGIAKNTERNQRLLHDVIVDALQDPDHKIWADLAKEQKQNVAGGIAGTTGASVMDRMSDE